jgi:hypothetical protein
MFIGASAVVIMGIVFSTKPSITQDSFGMGVDGQCSYFRFIPGHAATGAEIATFYRMWTNKGGSFPTYKLDPPPITDKDSGTNLIFGDISIDDALTNNDPFTINVIISSETGGSCFTKVNNPENLNR